MLTHGGAAAEDAITSRERHVTVFVRVDWNRNGQFDHPLSNLSEYVESAETDRSLSGSAPSELMLIEGASAAQLKVTISGQYERLSFSGVFSPYNGFSPLYGNGQVGCKIEYWIGVETVLGIVWYKQFTGEVRLITPNRATGKVEISALDYVEKMHVPASLPNWSIMNEFVAQGRTRGQLQNSQGVIHTALQAAGASASPYIPNPRVNFWLDGHGSYLPTIGVLARMSLSPSVPHTEVTGTPMFTTTGEANPSAPDRSVLPLVLSGMRDEDGSVINYWIKDRGPVGSFDSLIFAGAQMLGFNLHAVDKTWLQTVGEYQAMIVQLGAGAHITIKIWNGHLKSEYVGDVVTPSPWVDIPPTGHSMVWVCWLNSATIDTKRVRIICGTNDTGWHNVGTPHLGGQASEFYGQIAIDHSASMSSVFFRWKEWIDGFPHPVPSDSHLTPSYAASLDKGLNSFSYMPKKRGVDAWGLVTEVAAAEMGSIFWDEDGKFRFWNYKTMLDKQSEIVRTLTLDDISNLSVTNSVDSIRNVYSIDATRKISTYTIIHESQDAFEFYVPANSEAFFVVPFDDVQVPEPDRFQRHISKPISGSPLPVWNDTVTRGFCVSRFHSSTRNWIEDGDSEPTTIVQAVSSDSGKSVTIYVRNPYGNAIRLAAPGANGQALFRADGVKIIDMPNQLLTWGTRTVDADARASIAKYGEKALPLSGEWHQSHADALIMFDTIGKRTLEPIPTTESIEMAGDPRTQLGDCVEVQDPEGIGESIKLQIYGITRTYSLENGLTDRLSVELIQPSNVGIWDSPQYGRWDETFIWSD